MVRSAGRRTFPAVTVATLLAVATVLALVAPAALGSTAATGRADRGAPAALPPRAAVALPTLVGIRAFHRPGVDRVVFELRGGLPARRTATYVDRLISDGRGRSLRIAGQAIL